VLAGGRGRITGIPSIKGPKPVNGSHRLRDPNTPRAAATKPLQPSVYWGDEAIWASRLWSTVSSRTPFHMETGKGTPPIAMHFQLRPDPLAK